ncbi:MAG: PQQ-dependent sugar dehydrogenase [Planctomycetota bacterium]|jgi:PQQ-dependent dehydrogenase (s-GDH family)|nr:PQQ-dependent sugar dehydrogenase [Planctomycetota bacterium]
MGKITQLALAMTLLAAGLTAAAETSAPLELNRDNFTSSVLVAGLEGPWHLVWGADNQLWVSERQGKRITRVNPETGAKKTVVEIPDAFPVFPHEGVLGFTLSPDGQALYVFYTYHVGNTADGARFGRVVKYAYAAATQTASNQQIILDKIPAGADHNAGRLLFGPDGNLYLSKGDLGYNQGGAVFSPIESQRLPTAAEVAAQDWTAYVGKVLRIAPDGSIPADNPELDGVKSHVFTYGHRNPQGLVFVGDTLFSSEQGPWSDDEINRLEKGGNYGWPHVAGFQDDNSYVYANFSAVPAEQQAGLKNAAMAANPNSIPAGVPVAKESDWPTPDNFKAPIKTFYTVPNDFVYADSRFGALAYTAWPTIAPSSVIYYPKDGAIPDWRHSLIVTALKNGEIYVVRLHEDGKHAQGDVQTWFHSANRYRVAALDPAGKRLFVATDNQGNLLGLDRLPTNQPANPGAILVFTYNK